MNIDQIIGRLMDDKVQGEEREALEHWKNEAQENLVALEEMKKIAALAQGLKGYEEFDIDAAWSKMDISEDEQLQSSSTVIAKEKRAPSLFSLQMLTKIAALLVVVFGSLFVIKNGLNINPAKVTPSYYVTSNVMRDVQLEDGSKVVLDKDSRIDIDGNRKISLKGRAFFEVTKSDKEKFVVTLPQGSVTVLGTKFSIDAALNKIRIFVEEGSVRYDLNDRSVTLTQGDVAIVENGDIKVLMSRDSNEVSWRYQSLTFRDSSMEDVVEVLSRHFKKTILIQDSKSIAKCHVTSKFKNESFEDVLNELSTTHGLKYEFKEGKTIIVSSNC